MDEFASFQKKVSKVLETGNEAMFQDECLFAKLQCDRKKFKCLFRQSKTVVVLNPRLAATGLGALLLLVHLVRFYNKNFFRKVK